MLGIEQSVAVNGIITQVRVWLVWIVYKVNSPRGQQFGVPK